ncbi:MAG: hypothetical protein JW395_2878 [Nitrospira sp.]|nr:hypothetical protein [Nitrospira sp.]
MRAFILPFRIDGDIPSKGARIAASPRVIVAGGGIERDAPADAAVPRVIGWQRQGPSEKLIRSNELKLKSSDVGEWEVVVSVPADAMIGVSIGSVSD